MVGSEAEHVHILSEMLSKPLPLQRQTSQGLGFKGGFRLGSKTKETPKSSDVIGRQQKCGLVLH
jgi:hypothetical protein